MRGYEFHGVIEQRLEGVAGLVDCEPGLQTAVNAVETHAYTAALLLDVHAHGNEEVDALECGGLVVRWQNANDLGITALKVDLLANDVRGRTKACAPKGIGNQGDRGGAGLVVLEGEIAAKSGPNAKGGQVRRLDSLAVEAGGVAFSQVTGAAAIGGGHAGESGLLVAPFDVVRPQQPFVGLNRGGHSDGHKAIFVSVRQGAEQQRVHHAEDGRDRSDA